MANMKSGIAAQMEQHTLDAMKYELEKLKEAKALSEMLGTTMAPRTKTKSKEELASQIADHAYKLTEELENIQKLLKEVQNIKFIKGDVVFHRKLGQCVVMGIEFNPRGDVFRDFHIEGLVVKLAHSEGIADAPLHEVLPKTETSEAIYGK